MPADAFYSRKSLPKLLIGFDFGTSYSSLAYYLDRRPDDQKHHTIALGRILPSGLKVVDFQGDSQVSSQLAWCRDSGTWAWGRAVDGLVERGMILESDRILQFKLCLESSDMAKSTRERVKGQFDKLPPLAKRQLGPEHIPWPERLVSLYLRLLWEAAQRRIRSSGIELGDHDIACWLGVPKFVTNLSYLCMNLWLTTIQAMVIRTE